MTHDSPAGRDQESLVVNATPPTRPVARPEAVTLRDGSKILIRPIQPSDRKALRRGFDALSPESRSRRCFTPMPRLAPRLLAYLTEIDHHDHEALLALAASDDEPVGVARYVRVEGEPDAAEVAMAVVDHWQGKGVATALLERLTESARGEGIKRFVATCLADNRDALDLVVGLGPHRKTRTGSGLIEVTIDLPTVTPPEGPLHAALRHAAAGRVRFRHLPPSKAPQPALP